VTALKWWQKAVFYQIYPRSFADGDGDGIGDFKGMTAKLDYLRDLGVDALWLSPHFPSPMWDCGYDISNYTAVAPEYGTLDDFRTFLDGAHARGLRLILDLVLNHTSDQHAWFVESKSNRTNPKADWYLWEDTPPNNWQSCFDGPAWTYAPERGQYYYHYFMKQQPDLNWNNPAVKQAMWDAVRFWLNLGVDGFRLDAVGTIFEDPARPDHPVPMTLAELRHFSDVASTPEEKKLVARYWHEMFQYQWGKPHGLMKELRAVLDEYDVDRMLVGEDDDVSYLGNGHDELDLVFNFPLLRARRLTPPVIRKNQAERLAVLAKISPDAWPCNTLGNHDSSRSFNHFGDGAHDAALARLHLALMLTLRGTPFLYNGEEIGMTDHLLTDIAQFRDTMGSWYYEAVVKDLGVDPAVALQRAAAMTRDKNRTPMQWSAAPNGGFCPAGVVPWLPVNPNHAGGVNVADQESDPSSLLHFVRHLLWVRRETPALVAGNYLDLQPEAKNKLVFLRRTPEQSVLVALNFSGQEQRLKLPALESRRPRTIFSSAGNPAPEEGTQLFLAPFEVLITELT
jgi:alpha-glucosidase